MVKTNFKHLQSQVQSKNLKIMKLFHKCKCNVISNEVHNLSDFILPDFPPWVIYFQWPPVGHNTWQMTKKGE